MSSREFSVTDQNRVRQVAKRAKYDRDAVNEIFDQSLVCQVGFVQADRPFVIPMFFARRNDELLFHGSTKSRLMQSLISGSPICISVTILDGLVLAKSLFHHSMNYRSVTAFGVGHSLGGDSDKLEALKIISDKSMPGRWDDARKPNAQELKATLIASVTIDSASAKIRTGEPVDDPEDENLPVWSGVIPISQKTSSPLPAKGGQQNLIPQYLQDWRDEFDRLGCR